MVSSDVIVGYIVILLLLLGFIILGISCYHASKSQDKMISKLHDYCVGLGYEQIEYMLTPVPYCSVIYDDMSVGKFKVPKEILESVHYPYGN